MTHCNVPIVNSETRIDVLWDLLGNHARHVPATVEVPVPTGMLRVHMERFESLACRLSQWSWTNLVCRDTSGDDFRRRAAHLVARLNQRVIPLHLLEFDSMTPAFLARTPLLARVATADESTYFELVGSPTEVTLRRYVRRIRQGRESESFTLTREMLGDLAIACEEFVAPEFAVARDTAASPLTN